MEDSQESTNWKKGSYRIEDLNETVRNWRQDRTLALPPLKGIPQFALLANLLDGNQVGDPLLDGNYSVQDLIKGIHETKESTVGNLLFDSFQKMNFEIDYAKIARGQETFRRYYYAFIFALTGALLNGFMISRFSDVLVQSGYASSPKSTFLRFNQTASFISRWMDSPLCSQNGWTDALEALIQVRIMHSVVRKITKEKWSKIPLRSHHNEIASEDTSSDINVEEDDDRGIPLNQYDLALVQLGFSIICIDIVEEEVQLPLSQQEKEDYIYLWLHIGRLLGINEEHNVCKSYSLALSYKQEFYKLVPLMCLHPRPSAVLLTKSAIEGFGLYTGSGLESMKFLLHSNNRGWVDTRWSSVEQPLPFTITFMRYLLRIIPKSKFLIFAFNSLFRHSCTIGHRHPKLFMLDILVKKYIISTKNDWFIKTMNFILTLFGVYSHPQVSEHASLQLTCNI